MADVKTLSRNSSCFIVNDASLAELVSLEISEESPSKSDFDISILLNNNAISLEEHCLDKDKSDCKISYPLSEDIHVPTNAMKTVSCSMSLDALAKNHLENHTTLSEWCFDGDFNLADILCADECRTLVATAKGTDLNDNLNLFGICLNIEDNSVNNELTKTPESDIHMEDLPELVDSCHVFSCHPSYSPDTFSPESVDSGFDETESISFKSTSSLSEKSIINIDNCPFDKEILTSSKQSLLSRAISARPKGDTARHAKLKKIRNELLKKQLPSSVIGCKQQKYSQISERVIDHSSECIITSSLVKIFH